MCHKNVNTTLNLKVYNWENMRFVLLVWHVITGVIHIFNRRYPYKTSVENRRYP